MKSIRQQEDELFTDWEMREKQEACEGENPEFVRDGMVDEVGYDASDLKIAYVLKEYAPAGKGNDLREQLSDGLGYALWCKVAYMTHKIRDSDSPDTHHDNKEGRTEMHKSICAFNLSKIGGNAYTDMMLLALNAMKRREFIQRQFAMYDPDLTICGGTFDILRYALGHEGKKPNIEKTIHWYKRCPGKYVVSTYHFSYPKFGYDWINEAVKEIRKFCIEK